MTAPIKSYFNDLTGLTGDAAQALPDFSDDVQNLLDETRVPENEVFAANATDQQAYNQQQFDLQENGPDNTPDGERRKREREAAADYAEAMADMQQAYANAMQDAEHAINDLGRTINKARADLDDFMKELDKNTIALDDGRKIYVNEDTGRLEWQDEQGDWHELENEEDLDEAYDKIKANGGKTGIKQAKIAGDQRDRQLYDSQAVYMSLEQQRRAIQDDPNMSQDEKARRLRKLPDQAEHEQNAIEKDKELIDRPTTMEVDEQERTQSAEREKLLESTANSEATDEYEALFGAQGNESERTISAAEPTIKTQENLSNPFMRAAIGEPVSDKPTTPDFKETPDMDVAAFTKNVTTWQA